MAKRKLLPVSELPLVGGTLCLDLVNTTGARDSDSPRERLLTYADLLVWCRRAGIVAQPQGDRLGRRMKKEPREAQAAMARVRELREQLYAVLRPLADGTEPSADAVAQLDRWWRADCNRRQLVSRSGVFELRLEVSGDEFDAMVWPIVASVVELLTSDRLTRLKRCGECDWLFLDESKNGSRTWCKKDCGDRVRARRHYYGSHGDRS
jgi:predicted RNA-binding Zn ribbon-like protein